MPFASVTDSNFLSRQNNEHADPGFPVPDIQPQTSRLISIPQAFLTSARDEDRYEGLELKYTPESFFLDQALLGLSRNVVVPQSPGDAWLEQSIEESMAVPDPFHQDWPYCW